ncbi:hypothetical protein [Streptomyces sp. NPDC018833]|uniref:hypothetical protein n=1 Tax=Streptomyces sp. NPDC018833 TaxID=3365053 RepID=UPI00378C79A4
MTKVQLEAGASTVTPATSDQSTAPNWVAAFHANDLLKTYDQAEAIAKDTGTLAASRLTDEQHLALDKAHADFWGVGPNADYANQLMHTAIFYLGAAVKASPDPAQALRALHTALGMTEG